MGGRRKRTTARKPRLTSVRRALLVTRTLIRSRRSTTTPATSPKRSPGRVEAKIISPIWALEWVIFSTNTMEAK